MKKLLASLTATLGILSGSLWYSILAVSPPVLALPETEVAKTLQGVPVFIITNLDGKPIPLSLARTDQNQAEQQGLAVFFISHSGAEAVVEQIEQETPQLEGKIKTTPVSLAKAYQLITSHAGENSPFAFLAESNQVVAAVNLLRQRNAQIQGFDAVPLFVAKEVILEGNQEEQRYLTIQQQGREVIPLYFDKTQLEEAIQLSQLSASEITIDVLPLEGVINELYSSDNENLKQIMLIPSPESLEFLQNYDQQ